MAEVHMRRLREPDVAQLPTIVTGYTTAEKYAVFKEETETEATFSLKLVALPTPETVHDDHLDENELDRLGLLVSEGMSVGAFAGGRLVGAAISTVEPWNQSLRVWEFHVAESLRRQGIGRRLMAQVVETAVSHNLRVIVCETQSSNVPAIRAYRRLGFILDGIDLSFYSNEDMEKESVAVFMKRYIP